MQQEESHRAEFQLRDFRRRMRNDTDPTTTYGAVSIKAFMITFSLSMVVTFRILGTA
jgi:hypothetical protein